MLYILVVCFVRRTRKWRQDYGSCRLHHGSKSLGTFRGSFLSHGAQVKAFSTWKLDKASVTTLCLPAMCIALKWMLWSMEQTTILRNIAIKIGSLDVFERKTCTTDMLSTINTILTFFNLSAHSRKAKNNGVISLIAMDLGHQDSGNLPINQLSAKTAAYPFPDASE